MLPPLASDGAYLPPIRPGYFYDFRVTQTSSFSNSVQVEDTFKQIIFYNAQTMKCASLKRHLIAMMPQTVYRRYYLGLSSASVGNVLFDGYRFYACVSFSMTTLFDDEVIVTAMNDICEKARDVLDVKPEENLHLYYLSSNDKRWMTSLFAAINDAHLILHNYDLPTAENMYFPVDPPSETVTKAGVLKKIHAPIRGETFFANRYPDTPLRQLNEEEEEEVDEQTEETASAEEATSSGGTITKAQLQAALARQRAELEAKFHQMAKDLAAAAPPIKKVGRKREYLKVQSQQVPTKSQAPIREFSSQPTGPSTSSQPQPKAKKPTKAPLRRNPDWDDEFNAEEDAFLKKSRSEMEIANYLLQRKKKSTSRRTPTSGSGAGTGSHAAGQATESSGGSRISELSPAGTCSSSSVEHPQTLQGTTVLLVDEHGNAIETTLVRDVWFTSEPSNANTNAPLEAAGRHEVENSPEGESSHVDITQDIQEHNAESTGQDFLINGPQRQVTPQKQPDPTLSPQNDNFHRNGAETSHTVKAASGLHEQPRTPDKKQVVTTPRKTPPTPYSKKEHVSKDLSRRKVLTLRPCKAPNVLLGTTPPTQPAMARVSSVLRGSIDGATVSVATRTARQKKRAAAEETLSTVRRNLRSRRNGDAPGN